MRCLLLLLLALAASARAQLLFSGLGGRGGASCQLDAGAVSRLDFKPVARACASGQSQAQACNACLCSLVQTFAPAFAQAGITPQSASGMTREAATQAITACLGVVLPPMQRDGVAVSSLMALQSCSTTPPCLQALGL